MSKRILITVVVLIGAFLAVPAAASAEQIVFDVSNEAGRPQSGVKLVDSSGAQLVFTDQWGRAVVNGVSAGDEIFFSRAQQPADGCRVPEDYPGVRYTVPQQVPSGEQSVVLPTMVDFNDPDAALVEKERELVGLINAERKRKGLAPVRVSGSLSSAAALHAYASSRAGSSCEVLSDTHLVGDSGWLWADTGMSIGNNGYQPTPAGALENIRASADIVAVDAAAIGVGWYEDTWSVFIAGTADCVSDFCLLTDDTGIPPRSGGGGGDDGGGTVDESKPPKLWLTSTKIKRKGAAKLKFKVANTGAGSLSVSLAKGRVLSPKAQRKGDRFIVKVKRLRKGRWTLYANFSRASDDSSADVCRQLKVRKVKKKGGRARMKVKVRASSSC